MKRFVSVVVLTTVLMSVSWAETIQSSSYDIGLLTAWRLWFNGRQLTDFCLYGVNILWWGRLGKVIQFLAALTIIAEIIGFKRLRILGESMHGIFTITDARRLIKGALLFARLLWRLFRELREYHPKSIFDITRVFEKFVEDIKHPERTAQYEIMQYKTYWIIGIISIIVGIFCIWHLWDSYSWWALLIGFLISGVTQILGLMVFIFSLFLLAASGITLNTLLFKPLAWILERENPGIPIKIISVILLLIGFHLDLLAS